jgi:hypothetical protein
VITNLKTADHASVSDRIRDRFQQEQRPDIGFIGPR